MTPTPRPTAWWRLPPATALAPVAPAAEEIVGLPLVEMSYLAFEILIFFEELCENCNMQLQ